MSTELDKLDPKSGKPIIQKPSWYTFPGYPKFYATTEYRGRAMSVDDYIAIINATLKGEGHTMDGFISKEGKPYKLSIKINSQENGLDCTFPPLNPLDLKCPKSGMPIDSREKFYLFPGYPKLPCWKTIKSREMSAEDYIKILSEPYTPVEFTEFISKNNKPFTARLYYNAKKNSIEFDFGKATNTPTNQNDDDDDLPGF